MTAFRTLLAAAMIALAPAPADAASLKPAATVEGDSVRLGDLFEDAGPLADGIVARAPMPGRRYVLDSEWLAETARAHGLVWRPSTRFDRIVVERVGRTIGRDAFADSVRDALRRTGELRNIAIEFAGRQPEAAISPLAPPSIDLQSLVVDAPSGRFSALAVVGAGHPTTVRIPLAGRIVVTREVAVLRRQIQAGEIIRPDDLTIAELREDALRADIIADAERAVGMAARRALRAGETLREGDVRPPVLVARNANVTLVLRVGGMSLSALGRAMDEGARGDTIRVVNVQTTRTIEAQVVGPDTVMVVAAARSALVN
jgi:flagella basal body P-ring formation protein FlgA